MNNAAPMASRDSVSIMLRQAQLAYGVSACLFVLCLMLIPFGSAAGQGSFRVDTLWTLKFEDYGFRQSVHGGAIGGTTATMLVVRDNGRPDGDSIRIFEVDLTTGRINDSMNTGLVGEVLDFAFAENSGEFAIATRPMKGQSSVPDVHIIGIWDWNTRQRLHTIRDTIEWLDLSDPYIGITSDGRRLFNATTGTMYDTRSGQKLFASGRCYATVKPVFTRDNRIVSTHMRYDTTLQPNNSFVVRLRDVETGDYLATFPGGPGGWITLQTISDDGRYVAVGKSRDGSEYGSVFIYDRDSKEVVMDTIWSEYKNEMYPFWLLFTPGGTGFFMWGYDLDVWNGEKIVNPSVYRSMGDWTPQQYFDFLGSQSPPQHTADWEYVYWIGGTSIFLSHVNLLPLSVENSGAGEPRPTIVPNPVSNQLEVHGLVNAIGAMDVQIADATGRIVFDRTMLSVNGNVTINVTELLSGTYLLQLRSMGEVVFSSQFVKF